MKQTALIICMVIVLFLGGNNVCASEAVIIYPIATINMFWVQAQKSININHTKFLRTVNIQAEVENKVTDTPLEKMGSKVNNALSVWTNHMPVPIGVVDGKSGNVLIWQVFSKSF